MQWPLNWFLSKFTFGVWENRNSSSTTCLQISENHSFDVHLGYVSKNLYTFRAFLLIICTVIGHRCRYFFFFLGENFAQSLDSLYCHFRLVSRANRRYLLCWTMSLCRDEKYFESMNGCAVSNLLVFNLFPNIRRNCRIRKLGYITIFDCHEQRTNSNFWLYILLWRRDPRPLVIYFIVEARSSSPPLVKYTNSILLPGKAFGQAPAARLDLASLQVRDWGLVLAQPGSSPANRSSAQNNVSIYNRLKIYLNNHIQRYRNTY